ncbi:MAG: hypothetical protein QOF24_2663 [Verrucomicrobiota bacterium]
MPQETNHGKQKTGAKAKRKQKYRKNDGDDGRHMNVGDFLFDSAYQIVTWVLIAISIGSFFYFLSKGSGRGMMWSGAGLICSITAMLALLADRYFFQSKAKITAETRPHVFFKATALVKPLTPGIPPTVKFIIANSGQTEAKGATTDITFYFSTNPKDRSFHFNKDSAPMPFTLAPTEQWHGEFRPHLVFNPTQVQGLNDGQVRLFVSARLRYSDIDGKEYSSPMCRMYDPTVSGFLIVCPSDIEFKENTED